jgi:S1-C subfamily serine protease
MPGAIAPRARRSRAGTWTVAVALVVMVALVVSILGGAGITYLLNGGGSSGSPTLATVPPPGADALSLPAADTSPPAPTLDARAVAARVIPTTVDLNADLAYDGGQSQGTAIVLTSSGLVVTDEHVIFEAVTITAQVAGTGRTYQVALIGADPADDVALLQLQGASGLTPATLGVTSADAIGDEIAAIGNANGDGPASRRGRITDTGESFPVMADGDWPGVGASDMLATDANVAPGQSGGPVVDASGRAIGMLESGGDSGGGYATPMEDVLPIAQQIAAGQATSRIEIGLPAILGVVAQDASGHPGAKVTTVHPGTPAQSLGMRSGDVITTIDSSDVTSALELSLLLVQYEPGDRATLTWTAALGITRTASFTMAAGPGP